MSLIVRDPPVPPSPVGLYGSDSVSFLQSGTGATTTDLRTRGRLLVYASDFGSQMVSTPGADINLATTQVNTAGGGTVIVPAGRYTIETSILQQSNVYFNLTGATLTAATGLNAPIIKNATAVSSGTCTITRTNRTATATKNGHGFSNGDWIFNSGANQLGYNGAHKIFNVTTNTYDFFVEKTTTTPATGTISVYKAANTNLGIIGGELVGNALNTTGNNYGIEYHGVDRFFLDGTFVRDTYHTCVAIDSGANGSLFNVTGNGAIHAQHNGCYLGTTNAGPSGGFSYVSNVSLLGCTFDQNGQTGIEFIAGRRVSAVGLRARANGPGITVRGISQLSIVGSVCEENTNHGIELFLAEGASDITLSGNSCCYNGDAGIFLGNRDTANTSSRIVLSGNVCNFNNQGTAPTAAYGIAVENTAACTLDQLSITGNICNNNSRGISFGVNGTASNVLMVGNKASGNTSDANFGVGLDLTTLTYGLNTFANTGGNGIIFPAVTTASFAQILAKSTAKVTAPLDAATNTLATITIPAGKLGTGGQIIIECEFTFTNSANNKTLTVQLDGSNMSNVFVTNELTSYVWISVQNDGSASAQRFSVKRLDGATTTVGSSTLAKDTSVAKDITIKATKAVGAESVILESYRVLALVNS